VKRRPTSSPRCLTLLHIFRCACAARGAAHPSVRARS
jgi:hypothetical protein